jgi:GNAT superfamily N-acetyltransferase
MERVTGPKLYLLARLGDRPVGAAFVAVADAVAMLHALYVAPRARRHGLGARLSRDAAAWGAEQGAETLALAVARGNGLGRGLYAGLGLAGAGGYHYRRSPAPDRPPRRRNSPQASPPIRCSPGHLSTTESVY